jgi:predicted ferric reductase
VARAGGLTSWWLLALSVFWGLGLSTRITNGKPRPAWMLDLHRFLGGLALIFMGVHIAGLVADNYTHFGWSEVLVPLASTWHPVAVAWGVVSLYLLVAVEVTSLLMRRIPRRWWRAVHSSSFVLFVLSSVHTFSAGTERSNVAVQWSAIAFATIFTFLMLYRALAPRRSGAVSRGTTPTRPTPHPARSR